MQNKGIKPNPAKPKLIHTFVVLPDVRGTDGENLLLHPATAGLVPNFKQICLHRGQNDLAQSSEILPGASH